MHTGPAYPASVSAAKYSLHFTSPSPGNFGTCHPNPITPTSYSRPWSIRYPPGAPDQSCPGRELLEDFARCARERGDFDWNVAYHPYPENLGEPRFWLDKSALPGDDTPRITFKNLEALTRFLARPEMLFASQPRRIILSEQGFHCRSIWKSIHAELGSLGNHDIEGGSVNAKCVLSREVGVERCGASRDCKFGYAAHSGKSELSELQRGVIGQKCRRAVFKFNFGETALGSERVSFLQRKIGLSLFRSVIP